MIILASGSPRRHQLLDMLGIAHEIDPSTVEERPLPGEDAEAMASRLAREKALDVARRYPARWVLGADTVVVIDGQILGKPVSPAEAEDMLARLSGREHRVVTAVALAQGETVHQRRDVTRVWFRRLDRAQIRAYVTTGEPLDKAGAYGVQRYGAALVERIEGDFFGVMGLPIRLVVELLDQAGLPYNFTR
ncbi:MAG: septum formation inhibitor Maf [Gemmatimonadetes bacterium]|nr:septum formation inhibitor Maf [Gemmatimonadota bacterium]